MRPALAASDVHSHVCVFVQCACMCSIPQSVCTMCAAIRSVPRWSRYPPPPPPAHTISLLCTALSDLYVCLWCLSVVLRRPVRLGVYPHVRAACVVRLAACAHGPHHGCHCLAPRSTRPRHTRASVCLYVMCCGLMYAESDAKVHSQWRRWYHGMSNAESVRRTLLSHCIRFCLRVCVCVCVLCVFQAYTGLRSVA